jgi:Zn-dependent peptidase ImmA (M78 family)
MKYHTTLLEDWIKSFYSNIGIYHPRQLDLHSIANRLGYTVIYRDISSRIYDNEVILDQRLSEQEQWQEFAHELCHVERHAGNQLIMTKQFIELQEFQANLFAFHFCIPTFMLLRLQLPENRKQAMYYLANLFNVTLDFSDRRIDLFKNRMNNTLIYEEIK